MNSDTQIPHTKKTGGAIIASSNVYYAYNHPDIGDIQALNGVSFSVQKGEYIAVIGRNGSGKSTLAKLINVLEVPDQGFITVFGRKTDEDDHFWYIRTRCGMVFQNPDNQIVGTSVEEDVAFGPENLGIQSDEIRKRVDESLDYVGLSEFAQRAPGTLSGGQKQKLAIAGILAMMPQILILDESTAMLDPISRNDFLALVNRLRKDKGITVLHITHDMSEASEADRILVLEKGQIVMKGKPFEVFSEAERIRQLGLDLPVFADLLAHVCKTVCVSLEPLWLKNANTAMEAIYDVLRDAPKSVAKYDTHIHDLGRVDDHIEKQPVMRVEKLSYSYDKGMDAAIEDISFTVNRAEVLAIIGQSGSGKTTLISHLNGILRPQKGSVEVYNPNTREVYSTAKNGHVKLIRKKVGLLFQYPEHQLFEETVEKDIAFGPKKLGLPHEEIKDAVYHALKSVGLDRSFLRRSPFELSGGQKRRVALAGVLASNPDILILDEPAAGLDPVGRKEIFGYIRKLKEMGKTIVLVSHNMDEAAEYADRIIVLSKGRLCSDTGAKELFSGDNDVLNYGLDVPELVCCMQKLRRYYPGLDVSFFNYNDATRALLEAAAKQQLNIDRSEGEDD